MNDPQIIARKVESSKQEVERQSSEIVRKQAALRLIQKEKGDLSAALAAKARELDVRKAEAKRMEADLETTSRKPEAAKPVENDHEINEKQAEIDKIRTQIASLEAKIKLLTAEIAKAKNTRPSAPLAKPAADQQLKLKKQRLTTLQFDIKKMEMEVQQLKIKLAAVERTERPAADALTMMQRDHDSKKRELARVQSEYTEAVRQKGIKTRL